MPGFLSIYIGASQFNGDHQQAARRVSDITQLIADDRRFRAHFANRGGQTSIGDPCRCALESDPQVCEFHFSTSSRRITNERYETTSSSLLRRMSIVPDFAPMVMHARLGYALDRRRKKTRLHSTAGIGTAPDYFRPRRHDTRSIDASDSFRQRAQSCRAVRQ